VPKGLREVFLSYISIIQMDHESSVEKVGWSPYHISVIGD
jgi:hypothetical protein